MAEDPTKLGFLSLPWEIGTMIYKYALVRPYDLKPMRTSREWEERKKELEQRAGALRLKRKNKKAKKIKTEEEGPYVALLATCKTIHAEGYVHHIA